MSITLFMTSESSTLLHLLNNKLFFLSWILRLYMDDFANLSALFADSVTLAASGSCLPPQPFSAFVQVLTLKSHLDYLP